MSAKSRHRVLVVPLLTAVTIFSACTIASGYALTTISLPRIRGKCVVCVAGVTVSPTLEIDMEAGPGGCQLRGHAHAHIRVAVLVADHLSGRRLHVEDDPIVQADGGNLVVRIPRLQVDSRVGRCSPKAASITSPLSTNRSANRVAPGDFVGQDELDASAVADPRDDFGERAGRVQPQGWTGVLRSA
jgi:hypothetical protein